MRDYQIKKSFLESKKQQHSVFTLSLILFNLYLKDVVKLYLYIVNPK